MDQLRSQLPLALNQVPSRGASGTISVLSRISGWAQPLCLPSGYYGFHSTGLPDSSGSSALACTSIQWRGGEGPIASCAARTQIGGPDHMKGSGCWTPMTS